MTPEQFYIWAPTVAVGFIALGTAALVAIKRLSWTWATTERNQELAVIALSLALAIALIIMASSVDTAPENTEPVKIGQCIQNE